MENMETKYGQNYGWRNEIMRNTAGYTERGSQKKLGHLG
jgi:hypothetical protein